MSDRHHQELLDLFVRVCDLPAQERAAVLERECADHPALRGEVDKLLAHHDRPMPALERMAPGAGAALLASALSQEEAPARIGRYRIVRVIGEGGMGVVYEAEQDDPKRRVALKVIRPGLVTPRLLRRFRHEAQVLGQLQHPGIAQIFEAGTADQGEGGQAFFAMELVSGQPLLEHAATSGLGVRERLELFARICDAVHHAHQKGVIHRDLKPENILVEEGKHSLGQPKVLDFGVARCTDADVQAVTMHTEADQLVGTVAYMSPEQVSGEAARLDTRSDVYCLGVILFELLSGRLPYDVRGKVIPEMARIIRDDEPSRLSSVNRSLGGEVETIVGKALEKDRERRYQSAAELAGDIRRYLLDRPILARPPSALYQLRKFARRNKALAAGLLIAFAAMAIATIVSLWQWREAAWQRTLAGDRATALEESTWESYRTAMNAAANALELGDPVQARRFLDVAGEQHADWEHRYLSSRLDPCVALIESDEPIRAAVFASNGDPGGGGDEVLLAVPSGEVQQWDPYRAAITSRVKLAERFDNSVALDALGRTVVAAIGLDDVDLRSWDLQSGTGGSTHLGLQSGRTRVIPVIAIGPGGAGALVGGLGSAVLWELKEERPLRQLVPYSTTAVAVSLDGRCGALAYMRPHSATGHVRLVSLDANVTIESPAYFFERSIVRALAVSCAGRHVVVGDDDGRVHVCDDRSARPRHVLVGHEGAITAAAISPDDRLLATAAADRTVRVWDLPSLTLVQVLSGHESPVTALAFNDDGTRLLSLADRHLRVFDLKAGKDDVVLRGHSSFVYAGRFTPDGSRLVSGAWDGDIRIWDAKSGEPLASIPTGTARVLCLDVSADGTMIVSGHEDGVRLWDTSSSQLLRHIPQRRVAALQLSRDGSRLALRGPYRGAVVLDPRSGEAIVSIELPNREEGRGAIAITADGSTVAADAFGDVVMVDARSGKEIRRLELQDGAINRLAFSADGTRLASGASTGVVRIWDVATGACLHELQAHRDAVFALAFNPAGTRLASGSDDRSIRIWDTARGQSLLVLNGHREYVYDLAFAPDGAILASASGDGTLRLWDTRPVRERRRR